MNDHLTLESLQALADGALAGPEETSARAHIRTCPRCSRLLKRLEVFDRSMRDLPLERAPESLTRSVMHRIGIAPRTSFLLRMVSLLPYLFGLLVVLGVLLAVYASTGVVSGPISSQVGSFVAETSAPLRGILGEGSDAFRGLGHSLIRLFTAGGVMAAIVPVLVAVIVVAFVDRTWGKRLLGR